MRIERGLKTALLAAAVMVAFAAGCGDDDDGPPDSAVDAGGCFACNPNTVCVQKFNASCQSMGAQCVPASQACPAGTCSAACEMEVCGGGDGGTGYGCKNRILCGGELVNAFTCYGP